MRLRTSGEFNLFVHSLREYETTLMSQMVAEDNDGKLRKLQGAAVAVHAIVAAIDSAPEVFRKLQSKGNTT